MILHRDIRLATASETSPPWNIDGTAPTAAPRRMGLFLAGLALVAGLLVVAASNDWVARSIEGLFASHREDPAATARAAKAKAIAKLIAETEADAETPALEGDDAVARNAELPKSTLPVEAARPFFIPRLSLAQASNAERCLTQAIYYEAATETDLGKAAVAQVILNRVRHPAYPSTVCGVVYQGSSRPGCQFSFACDGSMRRVPVAALWRRSAEIARAALAGHVTVGVGMATHYHANYVLPRWAPKLTKIEQIGAHIFYRWPGSWGKPAAFTNGYSGNEWIPAFSQLYQGGNAADDVTGEIAVTAQPMPRDPTDHRADNDVGGRVDVTKGWTPNIPDPTQGKSRFDALTNQQGSATLTVSGPASGSE
ncbi:MAG: cell wall hydrolase [Sphingopyxis sp.]|uniref:cell wall hydrolase n=1 Tax=Sphingopyxis sp. TaxID=1908224 RepID=UPI002ABC9487|nr:cell wall hydrolase [Sphingopyxis sp.]MDZ3833287.1 cell wall hydrolase [Sphingopyxis sp.]